MKPLRARQTGCGCVAVPLRWEMGRWESEIGSRFVVDQESERGRRVLKCAAAYYHIVDSGLYGAATMSLS